MFPLMHGVLSFGFASIGWFLRVKKRVILGGFQESKDFRLEWACKVANYA